MNHIDEQYEATGYITLFIVVVAAVFSVILCGCMQSHKAAWLATASALNARDAVDDGMSEAFQDKMDECLKLHGSQTLGFKTCMEESPEYRVMRGWRVHGLPAVNGAVKSAVETLNIAAKVNTESGSALTKVLGILKDAVCGMVNVVNEFQHLFPEKAKAAMNYISAVKVVCK
jgi:hypothetical protein